MNLWTNLTAKDKSEHVKFSLSSFLVESKKLARKRSKI